VVQFGFFFPLCHPWRSRLSGRYGVTQSQLILLLALLLLLELPPLLELLLLMLTLIFVIPTGGRNLLFARSATAAVPKLVPRPCHPERTRPRE
jgi:hypothetical protein